jgi:hypothetical protein
MTTLALRPLSTGEILDHAFGLFRHEFATLVTVSAICSGVPVLVSLWAQAEGGLIGALGLSLLALLLSMVGNAIATGASTFIVSGGYLGHELSAAAALRRAVPLLVPLVTCSFGFTLLLGFGFILLLVPGFIVLAGCVLCYTALVVEGLPAGKAIGRSWELTRDHRWRMLGLLGVFAVVVLIPGMAIGAGTAMFSDRGATFAVMQQGGLPASMLISSVLSALVRIILYPFLYCILVTTYYDLRVRKEGFDLELLAGALTPDAG